MAYCPLQTEMLRVLRSKTLQMREHNNLHVRTSLMESRDILVSITLVQPEVKLVREPEPEPEPERERERELELARERLLRLRLRRHLLHPRTNI
jgi:hypothetical protein